MSKRKLQWTPWHEVVQVRDDLKSGELSLAIFAADLYDVVMNKATKVYQEPTEFFALTYPTYNLRELTKDVIQRLAGKKDKAVRPLELAGGGGATPSPWAALGENGIKTRDDLADLATDELLEFAPAGSLTENTANEIIMAARAHWFEEEDAKKAEAAEEAEETAEDAKDAKDADASGSDTEEKTEESSDGGEKSESG